MNSFEQKLKLGRSDCKHHALRAYLSMRELLQFHVIIPRSLSVRRWPEQRTGTHHGCPAAPPAGGFVSLPLGHQRRQEEMGRKVCEFCPCHSTTGLLLVISSTHSCSSKLVALNTIHAPRPFLDDRLTYLPHTRKLH